MNAQTKHVPVTAEPLVVALSKLSPVETLLNAAVQAGQLWHTLDCAHLAHDLSGKNRKIAEAACSLEADTLDKTLLQIPRDMLDVALLSLVMVERSTLINDGLDEDLKPLADAVDTAIMRIGGFALSIVPISDLARIPERMRSEAEDWLANVIGTGKAKEAFAK